MAAPDYTDIAVALATASRRTQGGDEQDLEELLHLSAGTNGTGTPVFRPFYAAARWIKEHPQWLYEATGDAKFLTPETAIDALLQLQESVDKSLGTIVAPEWAADLLRTKPPRASIGFHSG